MDSILFYDIIDNLLAGLSLEDIPARRDVAEIFLSSIDFSSLLISLNENKIISDLELLSREHPIVRLYENQEKTKKLSNRQLIIFSFVVSFAKTVIPKLYEYFQKQGLNVSLDDEMQEQLLEKTAQAIHDILFLTENMRLRNICDQLSIPVIFQKSQFSKHAQLVADKSSNEQIKYETLDDLYIIKGLHENGVVGIALPASSILPTTTASYLYIPLEKGAYDSSENARTIVTKLQETYPQLHDINDQYIAEHIIYKTNKYESILVSFLASIGRDHEKFIYPYKKVYIQYPDFNLFFKEVEIVEKKVQKSISIYRQSFDFLFNQIIQLDPSDKRYPEIRIRLKNFLRPTIQWDDEISLSQLQNPFLNKLFVLPLICEKGKEYTWQDPYFKDLYSTPTLFDFVNETVFRIKVQGGTAGLGDRRLLMYKSIKDITSFVLMRAMLQEQLFELPDGHIKDAYIYIVTRELFHNKKLSAYDLFNIVRIRMQDEVKEEGVNLFLEKIFTYNMSILSTQYYRHKGISIKIDQKYAGENNLQYLFHRTLHYTGMSDVNRSLISLIYSDRIRKWQQVQLTNIFEELITDKDGTRN